MKQNQMIQGHGAALMTILIWGTTFISTKVLLKAFMPIEILFYRFVIGFVALCLIEHRPLKVKGWQEERWFILAGLCGITLYYLLENIALTYTSASNVGVIISVAPFFTALFTKCFIKEEEGITKSFMIGFVLALAGLSMIHFGSQSLKLNPIGDLLALGAAVVWAAYSVLSKKISHMGYSSTQTTKRVFAYGLIFMLPVLKGMHFQWGLERITEGVNLLNLLFLGLGASALCFVSWNIAIRRLGAIRTSLYIYLVPIITICASSLILKEPITFALVIGTLLTLSGLVLSEQKADRKEIHFVRSYRSSNE